MVELPQGDWSASDGPGSEQTTTMRGAAFRPEYVQWSLRHRNLRRTSGVPLNNIFWCVARAIVLLLDDRSSTIVEAVKSSTPVISLVPSVAPG